MAVYQLVQMFLRGFVVFSMAAGLLLSSENSEPNRTTTFITSGVFGGCLIMTLGLMIDAGLQMTGTDKFVECIMILQGIIMNFLAAGCAYCDFYSVHKDTTNLVNKGLIATVTIFIFVTDVVLLYCSE